MNLDDKVKRLGELKKIDYPSDQEFEEIEKLEEEIKDITNEVIKPKPTQTPIVPPKNKSLLRTILRLNPPKPVTRQELENLKLIAQKEELKTRIAKAKGSRPSIIERVLGKSSNNPFDVSSSHKPRKRSDYDPFSW